MVCAIALTAAAPADPTPAEALDKAVATTRAMAFRAKDVDWPTLEARVRAAATDAKDLIDLLPAFEILVEGLGDGHSFVNVSTEDRATFRARYGYEFDAKRSYRKVTSKFRGRRQPESRALAIGPKGSATLVTVPQRQGGGAQATAYAEALYANVAGGAKTSCGYLVDLRGNQGGNVWPMVAGLSPLLGEGWRSYEIGRDGKRSSAGYLKGGSAIAGEGEYQGQTIVTVADALLLPGLAKLPVAVLIDDAVGSSGEGVAVAFKGRRSTRFFGQQTYGAASSNEGFMVGDRINIVVTTAMMADRRGTIYPDGVPPDDAIAAGPGSASDPDDAVEEAAKRWLAEQKSYRRPRPAA